MIIFVVNNGSMRAVALCGRMTFVQSMESLVAELGIIVVAEFMEQLEIREEVRRVCIDLPGAITLGGRNLRSSLKTTGIGC